MLYINEVYAKLKLVLDTMPANKKKKVMDQRDEKRSYSINIPRWFLGMVYAWHNVM